jgi:tRNA pseudouridine32 synthase / 23S rRNA pseudouridine746 synthase
MDCRVKPGNDPMRMTPEEMVARLLYRDGLMLVIDKPAGLPVHRGPKGAATKAAGIQGALQDHFDALRFGLLRNSRIVSTARLQAA